MALTASPVLPHPDSIRAAIKSADERARLLRRLLRLALRLQLHLTTADQLFVEESAAGIRNERTGKGVARG